MDTRMPYERITRDIFERKAAKTDPKHGSDPSQRPLDKHTNFGIICVNKPKGPTSHQVSAYARQILSLNKAGHSGTLDPKVTGVLPVALGRATRIVQTLLPAGKEYVCLMHLHKEAPEDTIRSTMESFVGKIRQLPPIKSSVKRQWRYRKIYYIQILEVQEKDVLFRVGCQAGTYIRKLCTDIGEKLGTSAHMAELIRTKAGPFKEAEMYTLQEIRDAVEYAKEGNETFLRTCIKPIEFAVSHMPKVWILDSTIEPVCHGTNLATPGIASVESDIQLEDTVALMSLKNELVAIGTATMISKDMVKTEKGIAVKTHKVFMEPGTYPRITGL
ncbi:MAG: RNA-guided pseudouridylation complex pseudouridine synthase subunit Cbf5 [Nanobdellota archaeon]